MALGADEEWLRDLRAQHGLGADAVDPLSRFYELKAYGGAEPDTIVLTPSEFERAANDKGFFLVVVSGLESETVPPTTVRFILSPLQQLSTRPSGNVTLTGIRSSQSLVYAFKERD